MNNQKYLMSIIAALILAMVMTGVTYAGSSSTVTKEELLQWLDSPEVVVLDVRTGGDWKASEFKIKGAKRANPKQFENWIFQHSKDKRFVTYCA